MLRSGDQIGPYMLVSKLGRGAFGVVWLAERRTAIVTTEAALKIPLDDDIDLEAVRQEAALWVKASGHPNVLPIIEANIYDGQVLIASEYAPGGSLETVLNRHGGKSPSIEVALDTMSGILAGLEHLHARSIIHRDLKPANILFQGETPRLADFGISRILKSTNQTSMAAGTPAYMAPEAFDGKRSEQTDIWSAGVLFHQLLSGSLPFWGADLVSLMSRITKNEPAPLPQSVPESLRAIVATALKKSPVARYKTAAEMRKAIRKAARSLADFTEQTTAHIPSQSAPSKRKPQAVNADVRPLTTASPLPETVSDSPQSAAPPVQTPERHAQSAPAGGGRRPEAVARRPKYFRWFAGLFVVLSVGAALSWYVTFAPYVRPRVGGSDANESSPAKPEQAREEPLKIFKGHSGSIHSVAFTADGRRIVSGGSDKTSRLWDVESGQEIRSYRHLSDPVEDASDLSNVSDVAVSLDGRYAFSQSYYSLCQWSLDSGGEVRCFGSSKEYSFEAMALSPDGKRLLSIRGTVVSLWDVESGKEIRRFAKPGSGVNLRSIAFSPDGRRALTGDWFKSFKQRGESDDISVRLWDVESGREIRKFTGYSTSVNSVAFSPDGRLALTTDGETLAKPGQNDDVSIRLLDLDGGREIRRFTGHAGAITCAAFSPDGRLAVSGGDDSTIRVWDIDSGREVHRFTFVHPDFGITDSLLTGVKSVAFSPDGKYVISAGVDRVIRLWKLPEGL